MSHDNLASLFQYNYVLSPAEWQWAWATKQDWSPILDAVVASGGTSSLAFDTNDFAFLNAGTVSLKGTIASAHTWSLPQQFVVNQGTTIPVFIQTGAALETPDAVAGVQFQAHNTSWQTAAYSYGDRSEFVGYRANGNSGAKTPIAGTNQQIANFGGRGWDGTVYATAGGVTIVGTETFTATAHGGLVRVSAVQNGTTVTTTVAEGAVDASGGFALWDMKGRGHASQLLRSTTAAAAGYVGEYIANTPTAIAVTSGTLANLGSIVLTAGDWDIYGGVAVSGAGATTITLMQASITTSGTSHSTTVGRFANLNLGGVSLTTFGADPTMNIIGNRVTAAATYFVNGTFTFASGTLTAQGLVQARRR